MPMRFPVGCRGFPREEKVETMRWLIIEDSLESRRGHWFEYMEDFCRALPKIGDEVTLLVSWRAEPFILKQLGALPCLPESAYLKMSDGSTAWRRYVRIPIHAWKTFWSVRRHLRTAPAAEVIFVPTVIVHHLLAWVLLVKLCLPAESRVLLFFPGLPIRKYGKKDSLDGSPTSKLLRKLLSLLTSEIRAGKVILGVETHAMKSAAEKVFGVPFTYFPHPVQPNEASPAADNLNLLQASSLTIACYGPARHEKGSDVLAASMDQYFKKNPASRVQFVLQWLDDFTTPSGAIARLPEGLRQHPRAEIVSRFFADGEYSRRLATTHVLVLPYLCSSYALRLSRVVIEAMVNGIPVVVTRGTTLAEQSEQFGAAVSCENENVESLVSAIETVERNYEALATKARERQARAREHFSVEHFRRMLLTIAPNCLARNESL